MFHETLKRFSKALQPVAPYAVSGRVEQVLGAVIRANLPSVRVGSLCELHSPQAGLGSNTARLAEVVGLVPGAALLAPLGDLQGISSDTEVRVCADTMRVAVGEGLLGCVLNGLGRIIDADQAEPPVLSTDYPVDQPAPNPMTRQIVARRLTLGVRAIDALMTCAEGQRIGIFAAAGGGKTTLLGMLVKEAEVDVCVVALIGERGREVREFIEFELGTSGRARSVVVVATADRPAMERLKAGFVATAVAEYFRDQGKKVLLLMDSVTRLARAQREIGLATGEPPTRRGFPPSVFGLLPKLTERSGMGVKGSITAIYTILVEGDDMTEPVADEMRSLLDGHIVLSRQLASENHYPAIDVLGSLSRVMNRVAEPAHLKLAGRLRSLLAKHKEIELLVRLGEYRRGVDAQADEALDHIDKIRAFLQQGLDSHARFEETMAGLQKCLR